MNDRELFWNAVEEGDDEYVFEMHGSRSLEAAIYALHDQPFGFSHEILRALDHLVTLGIDNPAFIDRRDYDGPEKDVALLGLACIAALLAPEDTK